MMTDKKNSNDITQGERIDELEMRVTFQEDLLNTLNKRLIEQDKDIATLKIQLKHLAEKVTQQQSVQASEAPAADERPPHY